MESTRSPYIKHLFVCVNRRESGSCCANAGGDAIREKLKAYVKANGLKGKVRVSASGCLDLCAKGANVLVAPDHRIYHHVKMEDVDRIIEEQLAPLVPPPFSGQQNGSSIRAFFFDLGNVLIKFDHMVAARKIAAHTTADAEKLYRMFFESPLIIDHDEGRISMKIFHETLRREIGLTLSMPEFASVWNEIFEENRPVTGMLRELLRDHPCYLVSNINRSHFEHCLRKFPFLHEMTGWILSYEIGVVKPHPVIYHRALELARVPAPHVFYIDDRRDLIEAARGLGIVSHHFQGPEPLKAELSQLKLLKA